MTDAANAAEAMQKAFISRLSSNLHLRPIDLARMAGLSVTQVRTYERLGFLPPAERGANGYRHYSMAHAEALRVSLKLMVGYGWQHAQEVMRAVHDGDVPSARALMDARHAALDGRRRRTRATLDAIDVLLQQQARPATRQRSTPLRISEAAAAAGVRPSAVRFWEKQGLLHPDRQPSTGYRLYDSQEMTRLNVVAMLREVSYTFPAIRDVLEHLSDGRPDRVRAALEERLVTLDHSSRRCMEATSALHEYLESMPVDHQASTP